MNKTQAILAGVWSVFAMIYLAGVSFTEIPASNENVVNTILGVIIGGVISTIMNYSFGSSQGSADKTKLLNGSLYKSDLIIANNESGGKQND